MAFNYRETQVVKGMLARGDRQHDIAAYFGVNGGRVGEVAKGKCDYPSATPLSEDKLPPPGPYATPYSVDTAYSYLDETIEELEEAGTLEAAKATAEKLRKAQAILRRKR